MRLQTARVAPDHHNLLASLITAEDGRTTFNFLGCLCRKACLAVYFLSRPLVYRVRWRTTWLMLMRVTKNKRGGVPQEPFAQGEHPVTPCLSRESVPAHQ